MNISAQRFFVTLFALPTVIYTQFFISLRPFDAFGLLPSLISSLIIILIMRDIKLFRTLIPFYFFSVFILCLSIYDLMPDSWTRYRDGYAAIRQWSWLPIMTLSTTSFYYLIRINWDFFQRNSLKVAFVLFFLSRSISYFTGRITNIDEDFLIYGLDNENALIFCFISIFVLFSARSWKTSLPAALFLLLMCSSATSQMSAGMVLIMLMMKPRGMILASTATACSIFLLVAPHYFLQLHSVDPNSSFRALLWKDAGRAISETYGAGVGYGTEYIRNDFRAIPAEFNRYVKESADDRLYVGTHSTAYDIPLRVGIIGFWLLILGLWRSLKGSPGEERYHKLYFGLLGALLINNTFNMGFVSINFTFATSAFFAIILLARNLSRSSPPKKLARVRKSAIRTRRKEAISKLRAPI